jgi:hypothetical protein
MSMFDVCRKCGHLLALHDIEDREDENPRCCFETIDGQCPCGKKAV